MVKKYSFFRPIKKSLDAIDRQDFTKARTDDNAVQYIDEM
jgi:hypothetical protein